MFLSLGWSFLLVAFAAPQQAIVRPIHAERGIDISARVETMQGEVIFSHLGDVPRVLASNNKLLTMAAVVLGLPSNYRWQTCARLEGNSLRVFGNGDPSLRVLPDRNPPDEFATLLASRLLSASHPKLDSLIIDARAFISGRPPLWPSDQRYRPYCAPPSAMALEGSCISITPVSGKLTMSPDCGIRIKRKNKKGFWAGWISPDREVSVTWDGKAKGILQLAVDDPARVFGEWLLRALRRRGVAIAELRFAAQDDPDPWATETKTLLRFASAWDLADAVKVANRDSDNTLTETLLLTLAREKTGVGSLEAGLAEVHRQLSALGISPDAFSQADGSGMSRSSTPAVNVCAPSPLGRLLREMGEQDEAALFFDSLPVGGQEGHLRKILKDDVFQPGRVRAKTGWITGASSLSGFMLAPDDETVLLFSIVVNYQKDHTARTNNKRFRKMQEDVLKEVMEKWTTR